MNAGWITFDFSTDIYSPREHNDLLSSHDQTKIKAYYSTRLKWFGSLSYFSSSNMSLMVPTAGDGSPLFISSTGLENEGLQFADSTSPRPV